MPKKQNTNAVSDNHSHIAYSPEAEAEAEPKLTHTNKVS